MKRSSPVHAREVMPRIPRISGNTSRHLLWTGHIAMQEGEREARGLLRDVDPLLDHRSRSGVGLRAIYDTSVVESHAPPSRSYYPGSRIFSLPRSRRKWIESVDGVYGNLPTTVMATLSSCRTQAPPEVGNAQTASGVGYMGDFLAEQVKFFIHFLLFLYHIPERSLIWSKWRRGQPREIVLKPSPSRSEQIGTGCRHRLGTFPSGMKINYFPFLFRGIRLPLIPSCRSPPGRRIGWSHPRGANSCRSRLTVGRSRSSRDGTQVKIAVMGCFNQFAPRRACVCHYREERYCSVIS